MNPTLFCLIITLVLFGCTIRLTRGCLSGLQFQCRTTCLPISYVCDGDKDCPDGSDERGCHIDCMSENAFQCQTGGRCIPKKFVCDGGADCTDASDETVCQSDPLVSNYLIVADSGRGNLFQVGLDDDDVGITVPLLPVKLTTPIAVAHEPISGYVYWTDVAQRTIGKYSLRDRPRTISVVKQFDATTVLDGLAITPGTQTLYYCDAGVNGKVGSIGTDGQRNRVLVQEADSKPRAIVLDPVNRMMYWTDWGNRSSINRANMDTGSDKAVLVNVFGWPNALAIDFAAGIMYWGDALHGTIQSARLDGTERVAIHGHVQQRDHLYALALTPQFIYLTAWTESAVRRLDRQAFSITIQPPSIFMRLSGIVYVAESFVGSASAPRTRNASRSFTTTVGYPTTSATRPTTQSVPWSMTEVALSTYSTMLGKSPADGKDEDRDSQSDSPTMFGIITEKTLIIIVCVGAGVVVLVSAFCSLVICTCRKRARQSSVRIETSGPGNGGQHPPVLMTSLARNKRAKPTMAYECYDEIADPYDHLNDNNIYYHQPVQGHLSTSSDGYVKPQFAADVGQQQQQTQPPPYQQNVYGRSTYDRINAAQQNTGC